MISRESTLGVIGAGTMGAQLAALFSFCGHDVFVFDSRPPADFDARRTRWQRLLKRNQSMKPHAAEGIGTVALAGTMDELGPVDLVMECVSEELEAKRSVLMQVHNIVRPETVIATNTSSLSVVELAGMTSNPGRFLGLHFFNPLCSVPLVELTQTPMTEEGCVAQVAERLAAMGRIVVPVADSPGFIVNRLLFLLIAEAARMVEAKVASPENVDRAMKAGANFPMGPLEVADVVGLDVCKSILENLHHRTGDPAYSPPVFLQQLVDEGHLGRKTGSGFYQRKEP